jgi:putative DNA primase/helicase
MVSTLGYPGGAVMGKNTDLTDLRAALIDRAADLSIALLGPPNPKLKSKSELRWGNKGSLSITVAGAKAGLWADHESGAGGDLFALITRQRGGTFPDAIKHARDFCGMRGNSNNARPASNPEPDDDERARRAVELFNIAGSIDHPIVERYLDRRKLILPDGVDGRVLRFNPYCPFGRGERHPAIIAVYRDIASDEPRAISRTALTSEGVKIDRKMLGPIIGCACKLSADEDVTLGLHIAEGIETSLAGMMLGFVPMWALGSAGAISNFPVLSGIECLTIIADHDKVNPKTGKTPGQTAARLCSQRWTGSGIAVRRVTPTATGEDLADIVQRREASHG